MLIKSDAWNVGFFPGLLPFVLDFIFRQALVIGVNLNFL